MYEHDKTELKRPPNIQVSTIDRYGIETLPYKKRRFMKNTIAIVVEKMQPNTRYKLNSSYEVKVFREVATKLKKLHKVEKDYGFWYGYILDD